jgi:hypothetical protein
VQPGKGFGAQQSVGGVAGEVEHREAREVVDAR